MKLCSPYEVFYLLIIFDRGFIFYTLSINLAPNLHLDLCCRLLMQAKALSLEKFSYVSLNI